MDSFDVYFLGETLPDTDPAQVRRGVAKLFDVADDAVDKLFSGKPLRVKKGVDVDTASRYRAAFRDAGALVQIVPGDSPPPAAKPPMAPPENTSTPTEATSQAVTPDTESTAFTLAEPGAVIDHTPPPPPAEIDTGDLEALPPNTGSLEDCRIEKPPRKIPGIGHLHLVDD